MPLSYKILYLSIFFCINLFSQEKIVALKHQIEITHNKSKKLILLDSITQLMHSIEHKDELDYLKKAVQFSNQENNFDLAAIKTKGIARILSRSGEANEAYVIIDSMLLSKNLFKSKSTTGNLYLERAFINSILQNDDQALLDLNKAINIFSEENNNDDLKIAIYVRGEYYSNKGQFIKSIDDFHAALNIVSKKNNDFDSDFRTRSAIAMLYYRIGLNKKSLEEKKKLLVIANKMGDSIKMGDIHLDIADSYYDLRDYSNQKTHIDSANAVFNISRPRNIWRLFFVESDYAKHYLKKNNLEKTWEHLQKSDVFLPKSHAPSFFENYSFSSKGEYYFRIGDLKKAEESYLKLLNKTDISHKEILLVAENGIAKVYAKKGNHKKAYEHASNYEALNEEINNGFKTNTFLYYQTQFEAKEKELTIQKLENEKVIAINKRKIRFIITIVLVLIAIIIIFNIIRSNKKKRKLLSETILKNKTELKSFTQLLIQKSEEKEKLLEELNKIKLSSSKIDNLANIEALISSKILTNEDWLDFKTKFNHVYPNFFIKIKAKGYNLTSSEERLLALENMKLNNNDIANMLGISPRSVITSRSRLRKKINIPKGASPLDYFNYL